jgi:glutamine synthetase
MRTKTKIKQYLLENNLSVLRVMYCDTLGLARSRDYLLSSIDFLFNSRIMFSESVLYDSAHLSTLNHSYSPSISGYPDFEIEIDWSTIKILPWETGVACVIADIKNEEKNPSPRVALKKAILKLKEIGYRPIVSPEIEFYVENNFLKSDKNKLYLNTIKYDPNQMLLKTLGMLDKLDVGAFASSKEFSQSQNEINLLHTDALNSIDNLFISKYAIKEFYASQNMNATFMAKPDNGCTGNGLHFNLSLNNKFGRNVISNNKALSSIALNFIAGVLHNSKAISAFTNPTVNSYTRINLKSGSPFFINWGYDNRTTLIRVPSLNSKNARLEIRIADGSCNPYLALASILYAGIDGIKNNMIAPENIESEVYLKNKEETLPFSLSESLHHLKMNKMLCKEMGESIINSHVTFKSNEVIRHSQFVTDWEIAEYKDDY